MSAANFYLKNASNYFAVSDRGASCWRLLSTGLVRGWSDIRRLNQWDGDRSYPAKCMMEKEFSARIGGGCYYGLTARIVRRSGYYSGALLDWDIETAAGSLWADFGGDLDDMAVAIVDDLLDDFRYYDGWNDGLCKIHRPRLLRAVSGALERARKESDALCAWSADYKLRCIGTASNGEAFYRKAI